MPKLPKMPGGNNAPPIMQFSKEALNSALEMKCLNEIPLNDKPGEFVQCGGEIFVEAARLKYISPIMSPTGQQTIATVNIGKLCVACGKVFSPDEWLKQHNAHEKALKDTALEKKPDSKIIIP